MLLSISICVDDLTKEKLFKAKNGKTYANLSVATLKEPNQWGKDVEVYEYEKETKRKHFVGNGILFRNPLETPIQEEQTNKPDVADDSDSPFWFDF